MSDRNPYLALMEDDDVPKVTKKHLTPAAVPEPPIIAPEKSPMSGVRPDLQPDAELTQAQPVSGLDSYLGLMGDDEDRETYSDASKNVLTALINAEGSQLSRNAPALAELTARAPQGSVAEVKAMTNPKKQPVTPKMAAQALAESRVPPAPPVPAQPAPKGGQAWLGNWANIDDPEFKGGVPEAAQKYQRGKPQGKVTSKLYKKFGNRPLNIRGFTAEQAALQEIQNNVIQQSEQQAAARAAEVERQAQATSRAVTQSNILGGLGKAIAGVGAGLGGYDVYQRLKDKDTHGAIASGIGTAASLAPLAIGTAGIAPAVGFAAPLYLMAHERLKRLEEHPEEYRLQQDRFDPMGNIQR